MSLTALEVAVIQATDKRQMKSCGDSLYVVVEPIAKGGGKSFLGITRFPPRSPKNGGKRVEVRIGPHGKGVGKWTLKQARDEWERIRTWSRETGKDPRTLKREEKEAKEERSNSPSLEEACSAYLDSITIKTKEEYRGILWRSALPALGAKVPVAFFAWEHKGPSGKSGREVVMDYFLSIQGRAPVQAERSLMVLRQVFDYAIERGWMPQFQNPALRTKATKSKRKPTPHATLPWDQLPKFFGDLEANQANGSVVVVSAVKVLFMTFLRVGSLAPLRWSELDYEQDLLVVPGERMKNGEDHLVPLTEPLKELLEGMRRLNGDQEFVFASPRSRTFAHISPYSLNQHFIRMGYKGVLKAHGVRSIPLTAGQEVLGFPPELIQRQMAHIVGDKVRRAYDRSTMLDERRKFMNAWCDALLDQGLKV